MAYASRAGRARVNSRFPQAQAVCDRCGIWYNRVDLQYQYQWAGTSQINLRRLVCRICLDIPQEQLRAIIVPADPVPIIDPRVETANEGNLPITVTTIVGTPATWLRDGYGKLIVDGYGNPILTAPGVYQTLVPADPTRTSVQCLMPAAAGLWINSLGGVPDPLAAGTAFYAPFTSFELSGTAAQSAVTFFSAVAGLVLTVQTQS